MPTTTDPDTTTTALEVATPAATGAVSAMPTPNEWQMIESMAAVLAGSELVPAAYRRKPSNVILATLAGRPFGWDPTMAMRSFHVIEGVPSMKPEIMLALIRRAGHSVTGETSSTGATVTGTRRDTGDTMTFSFTDTEASAAGLLNKNVWKQYPSSMYWARALAQLARMLFPDVVLGAGYTPEELGARIADDDVIDLADVDGVHVAAPTVTEAAVKNRIVQVLDGDIDRAREVWLTRPEHLRPDGTAWAGHDTEHRGLLHLDAVEAWLEQLDRQHDEHAAEREAAADITDAELVETAGD